MHAREAHSPANFFERPHFLLTTGSFLGRCCDSLPEFPQLVRGLGCVALCACAILRFLVIFLGFGVSCRAVLVGAHGFSVLCALACAQPWPSHDVAASAPPCMHHSPFLICVRGGWGCRPSEGCCSAVARPRSCTVHLFVVFQPRVAPPAALAVATVRS